MFIEELYDDNHFNDYLVYIAGKNLLPFDDFKQTVFLEIMDKNISSLKQAYRAVWRTRERMKQRDIRNKTVSLDAFGDTHPEETKSVLWEDVHIIA